MPKLKTGTIHPTPDEAVRIQAGINADPDAYSLSAKEWEKVEPPARVGRPQAEITKEHITIRLSRDVVTQFRETGDGWQTRMDSALRQFITEHPLSENH